MEFIVEEYRDVIGVEGYEVSNLGNVISTKQHKERLLKKQHNGRGYLIVYISYKNKTRARTVHQLVAESFLGFVPNGYTMVVNHKNLDKLDNRLINLEIVTFRQNTNKRHLKSTSDYTGVSWSKTNNKWISQIVIDGKTEYLGQFNNEIDASKAYKNKLKEIKNKC